MTSVSRYTNIRQYTAWAAWVCAAGLAVYLFVVVGLPPQPPAPELSTRPPATATSRGAEDFARVDWSVFRNPSAAVPVAGKLAGMYRLAGTFAIYGRDVANERRAIITHLGSGEESMVGEGDTLDDSIEVVRVLHDRVVLRQGEREEQLWLTFALQGTDGVKGATTGDGTAGDAVNRGLSRFGGKQVGENRWVFSRQKLLGYYTELMNEPERLVKVFDSLHPLYNDEDDIEGYQLHVEGEPEFFDSVGFREDDVVRKVNKLPMTNRRRAEFFIEQFVEGNASAFVIDIERNGEPRKLIYQIR